MDKALSSCGWFQRKRTFSQGSFSLHSVILPVLFLPVIHWGSRTVLPFHGIFSFFPAKLILCTLCFMWAAKQMGTSMWLFSLIINSLTFYFILVCSRNSVLFTSRNEPILPALQCVVNAGEEEVQKGCSTSGTLIIEAWLSEYFSIEQRRTRDQISKAAFSCPTMNCPSLSCSSLGYLWHTSNFYNKWDSDLTDNTPNHFTPPLKTLIHSPGRS